LGTKITDEIKGIKDQQVPPNFFSARTNLYGMGIPSRKQHLHTLRLLGVELLVSTTIDALCGGRMINHQPNGGCHYITEFTDTDDDLLEDVSLAILHLPVNDGHPPTEAQMREFLTEANRVIDGGGAVAVHCWHGKGRTATFLAGYLIHHDKMNPTDAIEHIRRLSPESLNSRSQVEYLTNPDFPVNPDEKNLPPATPQTPRNAECYKTSHQLTEMSMRLLCERTVTTMQNEDTVFCGYLRTGLEDFSPNSYSLSNCLCREASM